MVARMFDAGAMRADAEAYLRCAIRAEDRAYRLRIAGRLKQARDCLQDAREWREEMSECLRLAHEADAEARSAARWHTDDGEAAR